MPRERAAILTALPSKGFVAEEGSGHVVLRYRHEGLFGAVVTIISRGSEYKQYSDDLLAKMCRALRVTRKQLNSLIDCDMDGPSYVAHLRAAGHIREKPEPKGDAQKKTK